MISLIKKVIALFLTVSLLGAFTANTCVYADSLPVLDLDVSGWGQAVGVIDKTGNTAVNVLSGTTTELKTLDAVSGQTKFLKLRDAGEVPATRTGVEVSGNAYRNLNEMSIEMWVNLENSAGRLASIRPGSVTHNEYSSFDVYLHQAGTKLNISYRPGRTSDGNNYYNVNNFADISMVVGKWTHIVLTRKWTNINSATRIGTCEFATYINGEKSTSKALTGTVSNLLFKDESDGVFNVISANALGSLGAVKVYNKILEENEIAKKYDDSKLSYVEFASTMNLESISEEDDIVSVDGGTISLSFDNYVDSKTVQEGIKFVNEDGSEIKGGAYALANSELTKNAEIKFGRLQEGAHYKLRIIQDLKSLNGISCVPYEKSFTATTDYIFYEDFMDDAYVIGENPPADRGIEYISPILEETENKVTEVVGNSASMVVCGDSEFKYISMNGNGQINKNSKINVRFPEMIDEDIFVVDLKVRPAAKEGIENIAPREIMVTFNQDSAQTNVLTMANGYIERSPNAPGNVKKTFSEDTKDKNGFYDLRFTYKKDAGGIYSITVSNINSDADGQTTIEPKNITTAISSFQIVHIYPQDTIQAASVMSEIAKIAVYVPEEPNILYSNVGMLERNEDEFFVAFSDDMDEESFEKNTFALKNAEGKYADIEFLRYDADERRAYISLNEYLNYNSDYELSVSGVNTAEGKSADISPYEFTTAPSKIVAEFAGFKDEMDNSVTTLDNINGLKAYFNIKNNSEISAICRVALVIYDSEGRVVKIILNGDDSALVDNSTSKMLSVETANGDLPQGAKVKAFVWAEESNGAISLIKPQIIGVTN